MKPRMCTGQSGEEKRTDSPMTSFNSSSAADVMDVAVGSKAAADTAA
jgi:hypothetical protein